LTPRIQDSHQIQRDGCPNGKGPDSRSWPRRRVSISKELRVMLSSTQMFQLGTWRRAPLIKKLLRVVIKEKRDEI